MDIHHFKSADPGLTHLGDLPPGFSKKGPGSYSFRFSRSFQLGTVRLAAVGYTADATQLGPGNPKMEIPAAT